jgi:predicted ester cyclase
MVPVFTSPQSAAIMKEIESKAMKSPTPTRASLNRLYRSYIDCLNQQHWERLDQFVDEKAIHNGKSFGLAGYRSMLINDFETIPDLSFNIQLLVVEPPYVTSRLTFNCSPKGEFLGLPINGRKIAFTENVIYEFRDGKIIEVWSVLDKAAIEAQI